MNNLKLLRYDLINGIWYRKIYFILPVVLGFISCIGAHSTLLQIQEYHNNIGNGTVMDYWIYLIQGSKPYKFDVFSTFETPIRWLCFYLLFLICLNNYPNQDINSFGIHILVSSKKRVYWWISKLCWIIESAIVYSLLCFLTISVYVVLHGGEVSASITPGIMTAIAKKEFLSCGFAQRISICLIQPICMLIMLGVIQMALSVYLSPYNSFLMLFALLVISSYKIHYVLFGNWGMPYRMIPIMKNGMNSKICIFLVLACTVLAGTAGYIRFRKKDLL